MRSSRDQGLQPAGRQVQYYYDQERIESPGKGITPDGDGDIDPGIVRIVSMIPHRHQVAIAIFHIGIAVEENAVATGPEADDGMPADAYRLQRVTGEAHDAQGSL